MHTTLISPFGERHSAWPFYAGFNEIHNTGRSGAESGEEVTPLVLDWISRNAEKDNWLLYVNYWDAHTPYRAPESFGNPFAGEPLPPWMTEEMVEMHKRKVGPHSASEVNMYNDQAQEEYPRLPGKITDMDSLRQMIDGYDCGIRYMDEHIGLIFDALKAQGIMDDLVIIITADHGENMGELGIYGEHGTADQGTCRIPMIIRYPGMKQKSCRPWLALSFGSRSNIGRAHGPRADAELGWAKLRAGAQDRPGLRKSYAGHLAMRACLPA
ncbi:sulfatase-like hydrolase/transferase [Paenibacillus rhizoplanae]